MRRGGGRRWINLIVNVSLVEKKSKCAIWKPDFGMCDVFGDYCKECYCGGALKCGGMLVGPAYKVDGEYKFLKDVDPKLLLPHKGMRWPRYSVKFKQVN